MFEPEDTLKNDSSDIEVDAITAYKGRPFFVQ